MKETQISLPELALVAGTRAALGAGVGLLIANYLSDEERKAAGWTLVAIGLLTTIPLGFEILGGNRLSGAPRQRGSATHDQQTEDAREQELLWPFPV